MDVHVLKLGGNGDIHVCIFSDLPRQILGFIRVRRRRSEGVRVKSSQIKTCEQNLVNNGLNALELRGGSGLGLLQRRLAGGTREHRSNLTGWEFSVKVVRHNERDFLGWGCGKRAGGSIRLMDRFVRFGFLRLRGAVRHRGVRYCHCPRWGRTGRAALTPLPAFWLTLPTRVDRHLNQFTSRVWP